MPTTIPLYFHYILTQGDRFDRPEAAAGPAPDFVPQIVFKLFIEIPGPFSTLFDGLTNADLTFEQLASLLAANGIEFDVQPLPGAGSLKGTLAPFPMLPFLTLSTPPNPDAPIDFSNRKPCSADFLNSLTDPFAPPKSLFTAQNGAAETPSTQTFPSIAAGMFTDYFAAAIRHLSVQANDFSAAAKAAGLFLMHSVRLPDPQSNSTRDYPLYVLSGQQMVPPSGISGGFSVTLTPSKGAKVPVSFPGGSTFSIAISNLPTAFSPADRILALTRSEPFAVAPRRFAVSSPVTWNGNRIYALPQSLRTQMATPPFIPAGLDLSLLKAGKPDPNATPNSPPPPPVPADKPYTWATRVQFTIRQLADPSSAGQSLPTIFEIAGMDTNSRDDLLSFLLSTEASGSSFQLSLLYSANPSDLSAGLKSETLAAGEVWLAKSNFSTQLPAAAASSAAAADITANPKGFLTMLWEASLVSSGGFYLFYGHGTGLSAQLFGQTGIAAISATIVPSSKIAAQPYRNCVVYPDPDAAFIDPPLYTVAAGDTLSAVASKLSTTPEALLSANATPANAADPNLPAAITIPASAGQKAYAVQPYDSFLSLALRYESQPLGTQPLDALWKALLAALPDIALQAGAGVRLPGWVAARSTIAPAAYGFRAVANPPAGATEKLFSFFGSEVRGLDPPVMSGSLAAGPQSASPSSTVNPLYRQILYLAPDSSPYSQIGQTATLALLYQDVFGNRCLPSSQAPLLEFQILYRDPLAGLSQWPGTTVSYDFDTGPAVRFTLAFETSRYVPPAGQSFDMSLRRAQFDLRRYNAIAQQIAQPGVVFQMQSSLTAAPVTSDDLGAKCRSHVANVQAFLGQVLALQMKTAAVTESDLASLAAANHVAVADLATVNQDLSGLLTGQLQIPLLYTVNRNETLSGIALRHNTTVDALAALNPDVVDLFLPPVATPVFHTAAQGENLAGIANSTGIPLATLSLENSELPFGPSDPLPPGTPVRIGAKPGDTPAAIAAATNMTVAQLFAANQEAAVLTAGIALAFGATTHDVQSKDTMASVARVNGLTVALLAAANQSRAILNRGVQIEIPVPRIPPSFPALPPVSVAINPTIAATVTPISVSIVIARLAGFIDQLFSDPDRFPGVQSIETEIRLKADILQTSDALKAFAGQFESIFGLALAIGPDQAGTASVSSAKRLYAIRFQGTNPLVQIDAKPRFYAPPPLLTTAWSGTVTPGGGAPVTFTNVDIDAWAREFVITLDLLLSAPYVAALLASHKADTYRTLASAKATVAGAMVAAVAPIFSDSAAEGANLAAAQDALQERVLVQLQEFYKVDVIVQFSVTTAYTGTPARLSGQLTGSGASATIDLSQPTSELTFGLHLDDSVADLNLNPAFSPDAVELESVFQGRDLAPGYEAFDRLLLLPSTSTDLTLPIATGVDVPIPLRAYPVPPSLVDQKAVQNLPPSPTLADLKAYDYRFEFNYAAAPQDQLQIGLTVLPCPAATDSANAGGLPPVDDLPEALANWTVFAAGGVAAFAGLLSPTPLPAAIAAADTFADLAANIAAAWSNRKPQAAEPGAPVLPSGATVAVNNAGHTVTVGDLDVIRAQSVMGSLHVTRNGTLLGKPVNAAFVYQVPTVRFTNPLTPLLHDDNPIDISLLTVPPFVSVDDPLRKQIVTLVATLLEADNTTKQDSLPNIRIAVSFEFALATASGTQGAMPELLTRTPVALLPPSAFDPAIDFLSETGICARVAKELQSWHTREASGPGTFVFDISLYSSVNPNSTQPLLELTNLRARVGS